MNTEDGFQEVDNMEITSKRLDLLYKLIEWPDRKMAQGFKYKLSAGCKSEPLDWTPIANYHNLEEQFTNWAHNDIAKELQGVIDDEDIITEIRIWNRSKGE